MKRYIVIALTLLMVSCGIYKPYSRPNIDIDTERLYGDENITADTTSVADVEWHAFFTDSKLQRLINTALDNNTDMQASHLRIEEAEAALKSARLAYLPSFNLSPNGGVSSFQNSAGVWTYSAPLTASWQMDIFGGITNAKRKAKAVYEQSLEYRQAVRTQLISAVANYYYTLVMLDAQHEVTHLTAESLRSSAETLDAMMQAGMSNRAAVSQMVAAAYSAQTSLRDIEQQIRLVENALCALLGETPHTIARSTLLEQQLPEDLSTGVPLRMLSNRPDVRMAEYSLMQSHYATAAARSALYPTITLNGVVGWANNAGSVISNPGGLILSVAATLAAPIFNAGKARAQVKIAEAQQKEYALAFKQSILNAGAEVNNALSQVQTSRAKRELRSRQIEALESAVESTQLLMQYGSATYLEVLTAQQNLLSGQISQITDLFDEIQGIINLYTALGGGRE